MPWIFFETFQQYKSFMAQNWLKKEKEKETGPMLPIISRHGNTDKQESSWYGAQGEWIRFTYFFPYPIHTCLL